MGATAYSSSTKELFKNWKKPNLVKAFEDKYQQALHKGITDIYVGDQLLGSFFSPGECPFVETSIRRMADGEEHTMDHSTFRDILAHPKGVSDFAKMPLDNSISFWRKQMLSTTKAKARGKGNVETCDGETTRRETTNPGDRM